MTTPRANTPAEAIELFGEALNRGDPARELVTLSGTSADVMHRHSDGAG